MDILGSSTARRALLCAALLCAMPDPSAAAGEAGGPGEMRAGLASMIQRVVVETRISIELSQAAATSAQISRVNGRSVCDPLARADVARLQRALDAQPRIHRNIGPALIRVTDREGHKSVFDPEIAAVGGLLKGCSTIYVSVHE